jgi:hypothetical protein
MIAEDFYSFDERKELARAIIRKYDVTHEFHCTNKFCGKECPFAIQLCPNPGCGVRFSKKAWLEHEAKCPEKALTCPNQCGSSISRRKMMDHIREECLLRVIPCPYTKIGCDISCKCVCMCVWCYFYYLFNEKYL